MLCFSHFNPFLWAAVKYLPAKSVGQVRPFKLYMLKFVKNWDWPLMLSQDPHRMHTQDSRIKFSTCLVSFGETVFTHVCKGSNSQMYFRKFFQRGANLFKHFQKIHTFRNLQQTTFLLQSVAATWINYSLFYVF